MGKVDAVAPDKREKWVAERVKQGIDVPVCHPRLVQMGLYLIYLPTLRWFETDYRVYVRDRRPAVREALSRPAR